MPSMWSDHLYRALPMTLTPWGPSEQLRTRRLRPGPGGSRAVAARNQRERLMGATVAVVAERGYEVTRVADLLELAGVSRSAFYRHFANKQECFVATVEEMVDQAGQVIAGAYTDAEGSWDDRLQAALSALLEMIVDQPAAARLCFVDVYAAGPEAIERAERIADDLVDLAVDALRESPERAGMPRDLVRAILGGLRQIIQTRLRHRREAELIDLGPDLFAWGVSYRTPPEPLRRPRRLPRQAREHRTADLDSDQPRERILAAMTELIAEKGYQATTITEIAQRASVSLTTFYVHFEGKEDALLATIDDADRRLQALALPSYAAAPDWPRAVRNGLYAFFAFLASNPGSAQLGGVDIYSAGPHALERHEASLMGAGGLLTPGYELYPETGEIAAEAIAGSIAALFYEQQRHKGAGRLYEIAPAAVFLALAPFTGSEEAGKVANEGWEPAAG
jgi:AcrR family transcriptional regulator